MILCRATYLAIAVTENCEAIERERKTEKLCGAELAWASNGEAGVVSDGQCCSRPEQMGLDHLQRGILGESSYISMKYNASLMITCVTNKPACACSFKESNGTHILLFSYYNKKYYVTYTIIKGNMGHSELIPDDGCGLPLHWTVAIHE